MNIEMQNAIDLANKAKEALKKVGIINTDSGIHVDTKASFIELCRGREVCAEIYNNASIFIYGKSERDEKVVYVI